MPAPFVFVHGWGGSAVSWDTIPLPVGSIRHAVELPGHGALRDVGPFTVPNAASILTDRLKALGEPVVLVGHSMGGQITAIVHAEHPELVHAECVINPAYGHPESDRERMHRWRDAVAARPHAAVMDFVASAFNAGADRAVRRRVLDDVAATEGSVLVQFLDSEYFDSHAIGFAPASRSVLARRTKPTLGVYSSEPAAAFERSAGSAQTVVRPGSGHYLHLESPRFFAWTLTRWLDDMAPPNR